MQDLRFAVRRLARQPLSTLAAVAVLALGVGATVVMADMLDRLLLRPPPHVRAPERVARLYEGASQHPNAFSTNVATIDGLARATTDDVEWWAGYLGERLSLGRGTGAERVQVVSHTEAYFDVLGVTPALGTLPSANRSATTDANANVNGDGDGAVISHALWQRRFGGALTVLGQPLAIGTRVYSIVAVTPRGFTGIDNDPVDVWLPIEQRALASFGDEWKTAVKSYASLAALARLRPGVDRAHAERRATQAYLALRGAATVKTVQLRFGELLPARAPGQTQNLRIAEWIAAVSALVLLAACTNVGNLLLMRGLSSRAEVAIKLALGAGRRRLAREVLLDASILAAMAGGAALLVLIVGGGAARTLLLPPIMASAAPLDTRLIVLTVGVTAAAALILGMVPALRVTSGVSLSPGPSTRADRPSRLLDLFACLQIALSVPLIVGAGLFASSLWQARTQNFGIQSSHLAVVSANLAEIGQAKENYAAHRRVQDRLAQLPQVKAVTLVTTIPLSGRWSVMPLYVGQTMIMPVVNNVDPAFVEVMGLRVIAGRNFTDADNRAESKPVMMVNESMARAGWPDQPAVGQCVRMMNSSCAEVVGVVADWAPFASARQPMSTPSTCLLPLDRSSGTSTLALIVRTQTDPGDTLSLLRREAQAAGGGSLPFVDVWSFDDLFQPMLRPWKLGADVFVAFALLSLVIASAGIAVVTAYGVTRRTRELGVRLALGAAQRAVVILVLRRSLASLGAGLALGVLLAAIGRRWLASVLFGLAPHDLAIFAAATILLLGAGLVAAWLPARRAARVDPAIALRAE